MNKVLLINPPLYFDQGKSYAIDTTVPPLGLFYLASYINHYSNNIKVEVMDVAAEKLNLNKIKDKISAGNYFAIGLTSMTPQLQGAVELARFIKQNFGEKMKIFLGGPHISADKNFIKRQPEIFDYAILGEAEKTFLESLNKLLDGQNILKIQTAEPVLELDAIPIIDKKIIKRKNYNGRESMLFSRGCLFNCYFCSRPSIDRNVRYRSVENLIQEIKQSCSGNKGRVDFQDDTFTLNKKKVVEFCQYVLSEKLKIKWTCNTRIDLVDENLLILMKKAGLVQINFGLESGSEKIRREVINKGDFTNQDIIQVLDLCKKNKIKIAGYFIIGHPTETEQELLETKKMILTYPFDLIGLSIPTPFPGSKLYQIAHHEGIINEKIIDDFAEKKLGLGYAGVYPVYISKNLTSEYIFNKLKEINLKFYFQPRIIWQRIKQDFLSWQNFKLDFLSLTSIVINGVPARKPYKNLSAVLTPKSESSRKL